MKKPLKCYLKPEVFGSKFFFAVHEASQNDKRTNYTLGKVTMDSITFENVTLNKMLHNLFEFAHKQKAKGLPDPSKSKNGRPHAWLYCRSCDVGASEEEGIGEWLHVEGALDIWMTEDDEEEETEPAKQKRGPPATPAPPSPGALFPPMELDDAVIPSTLVPPRKRAAPDLPNDRETVRARREVALIDKLQHMLGLFSGAEDMRNLYSQLCPSMM